MPGAPFLRGEHLALCPVEPDDHDFLARHLNDPRIRHGIHTQEPISTSDAATEYEHYGDGVYLLSCRDGEPIGLTCLFDISDLDDRGEIAYWIAPDETGEGYGTETARLCLQYAFDERNLRKVVARAFEQNEASRTILEKLGFREEGWLRDHYYVDGEYVDTILYGLLENEWEG